MVERLREHEIPAGRDLWNSSEHVAENLYTIPVFSTETDWNLAECSGKLLLHMFSIFPSDKGLKL